MFPELVPLHTTGPTGLNISMISAFPPTRAIENPFAIALAKVDRSGLIP